MHKRTLIYRRTNGQIYPQLIYGEMQGSIEGELGAKLSEIEILDHTLTFEQAVALYPHGQETIRQQHGSLDTQT